MTELSGVKMQLANNQSRYGWVAICLHWSIALLTICLFILGIWMVELDYYDSWYQQAPWWHKGLGVITLWLIIGRWLWQLFSSKPKAIESISAWQNKASWLVHRLMNFLIITIAVSGYLMVTAKGKSLSVFDWYSIPAIVSGVANLEDIAGEFHFLLAYGLIGLVLLHSTAALLHHYVYKDETLKRMLGR
jgi:cytochrome b561